MPEPSEQNGRFQFSLQEVLLVFVVVASSIGMAGSSGLIFASGIIFIFIRIRTKEEFPGIELMIVLALCGIVWIMFNPGPHGSTINIKMGFCQRNFTRITQALNNYHDTYGRFPPASVPDSKGQPAHSWRVLILPFLGYEELYRQYKFDEPWDGPNNSLLATEMPYEFECPSCYRFDTNFTNRVAVIGSDSVLRANRSLKRDEISDNAANTIMLVETDGEGVHWMEPVDLPAEKAILPPSKDPPDNSSAANSLVLGPIHKGCFHAVMADGTVDCLQADIPQSTLDAMATANGGESVELKRLVKTEPSAWAWPVSLVIFLVSSITMLCGAGMAYRKQARTQMQSDSDLDSSEDNPGN